MLLFASSLIAEEDESRTGNVVQLESGEPASSSLSLPELAENNTSFDRTVALYAILDGAVEADLRELLQESRNVEHASVRNDTQVAIASRIASINPQEALVSALEFPGLERAPLLEGVFAEWSESDLEGATEAAMNLDQDSRLIALRTITTTRDDLDLNELRAIARELDHAGFTNESEREFLALELAEEPTEVWHRLIHDGREDAAQLDTLVQAAEAAVELEGLDVLFKLRAPFSNVPFEKDRLVLDEAVEALIRNDPQGTWKYILSGYPTEPSQSVEKTGIRADDGHTLRERAYMTDVVQELLLKAWAAWDPATVFDRIDQIPRHLQAVASERAIESLVDSDPERAAELVQSLKHLGTNRERAIWRFVRRWSAVDPSAALVWLQSQEGITKRNHGELLEDVLQSLILEDPEQALQVASAHPNAVRLESRAIMSLAESDVEAAVALLPKVSPAAEDLSTWWVANQLIKNGEVDRAVELQIQFEAKSGEPENWFMFFLTWASANPVQLFERMEDFPPILRFEAAHALNYNFAPELTQEQKDHVRAIYEEGKK